MNDQEIYDALRAGALSPTELDIWFAGLSAPTATQYRLYAQGRALILNNANELTLGRVPVLHSPSNAKAVREMSWQNVCTHEIEAGCPDCTRRTKVRCTFSHSAGVSLKAEEEGWWFTLRQPSPYHFTISSACPHHPPDKTTGTIWMPLAPQGTG